jgi:uncharacterized protein (TIGR03435 family)
MYAFNLPQNQITNAPDWLNSAVFDIHAKLPAGSSKEQVPEMLQSFLADRFKLVVHHQSEIRPIYELVAGNKLNLKPSDGPNTDDDKCKTDSGHRVCRGMTMGELAKLLSSLGMRGQIMSAATGQVPEWLIDRPVVDKTGITGPFDIPLDFGRIAGPGGRGGDGPMPPLVRLTDSIDALGLKLHPAKGPFDVIVIDHIERTPTEN